MSKTMEKGTENAIFLDGRDYTAADLYRLIGLLVGNGVYMNELAPTATNEDMSITHGAGHAWIGGVAYWNTTPFILSIATADGSLNRYDSLMLRLDLSINEVYAVIIQGAYATNPTPPACIRNAETFDLKICDIYVPAGCTKITQDQITDTRLDSSVCGVPVFPVEHLDMTTFYKQITSDLASFKQKEQTDFANWAEDSKAEILDLLKQLNELVESDTVGALISDINNALKKTGGVMEGDIDMNGQKITGLNAPTSDDEPATKGYADNASKKRYASACGSASALALPWGEITPLTLDTWKANSDELFEFSEGGIVMPSNGTVLVCASIYFNTSSSTNPENVGPYVKKNGTEIGGQVTYSTAVTAVSLSPFLAEVAEGDVLTLCARNTTRDGSCIPNAQMTALTVIYL